MNRPKRPPSPRRRRRHLGFAAACLAFSQGIQRMSRLEVVRRRGRTHHHHRPAPVPRGCLQDGARALPPTNPSTACPTTHWSPKSPFRPPKLQPHITPNHPSSIRASLLASNPRSGYDANRARRSSSIFRRRHPKSRPTRRRGLQRRRLHTRMTPSAPPLR